MKRIFLFLLLLFVITACDNNKEPFSRAEVNGEEILLSREKPAEGEIKFPVYLGEQKNIAWKGNLKNGVIDGKVVAYSDNNEVIFEGEFRRKREDIYEVDIKLKDGYIKGNIGTTSSEILDLLENLNKSKDKEIMKDWFTKRAINGRMEATNFLLSIKDGKINGEYIYVMDNKKIVETYNLGERKSYEEYDIEKNILLYSEKPAKDKYGQTVTESINYDKETGDILEYFLGFPETEYVIKSYVRDTEMKSIYYVNKLAYQNNPKNSLNIDGISIYQDKGKDGIITLIGEEYFEGANDDEFLDEMTEYAYYTKDVYKIPKNMNLLSMEECDEIFYEIIDSDKAQKKGKERLINKMIKIKEVKKDNKENSVEKEIIQSEENKDEGRN